MGAGKIGIIKNINKDSKISMNQSADIINSFLFIIKSKSKLKSVKISGFGTFSFKKTPKRIGRNPKTQDSYIIPGLNKLNFKPSQKVKEKINWKKYYSHYSF